MKTLLKIVIGFVIVFMIAITSVFFLTAGIAETADNFFKAIKNQDISSAHSYLSEDFKASTDEAALSDFLSKGALLKFKETSWSNRQISGGRGHLEGEVITETGGVVPLTIMFVKENDTWKIYGIQKPTAGLQPENTSPSIPSQKERVLLVKRTVHDFVVSVNDRSMSHFHKTISQLWKREVTPQILDEAFGAFYSLNLDLSFLDGMAPILEKDPEIGEAGQIILKGHYPTKPNQVQFETTYIFEGLDWKLAGFGFNIK